MAKDRFCLFSGGKDSTVMTHLTMRMNRMCNRAHAVAVYLDTGTGLDANREYVERICDKYGWQLWTLRTHEDYETLVKDMGFPGPGHHYVMYQRLKRRQLEKLAATAQDPYFYTGVRQAESNHRMAHTERTKVEGDDRWLWVAPILEWSDEEVWQYIDKHDIPHNDEWYTGGRASDCFCGAYGTREELIGLQADHPDHFEWLMDLEDQIDEDEHDERAYWAWGNTDNEHVGDLEQRTDGRFTLCSGCGPQ